MDDNYHVKGEQYDKNHCLDFLKGIGCIAVVFIHATFPGDLGMVLKLLGGFVVPMFFMISGYYIGYKDREVVNKKLHLRIKHILFLSLISFIIYFSQSFFLNYSKGGIQEINQWLNQMITIKCIAKFLILNDLDVINGGHLWFLFALLYCYILLVIINKYNLYKLAYYSIPLLFLCRILITIISKYNWHYGGNFILGGLPYFMLGNLIKRKREYTLQLNNKTLLLFMFSGGIFGILSTLIELQINIFSFGIILYAISIFIYALNNPSITNYKIEKFGMKYSLFIYINHVICINIIDEMAKVIKVSANSTFSYIRPILVVILTILLACVYYYIKDKIMTVINSHINTFENDY